MIAAAQHISHSDLVVYAMSTEPDGLEFYDVRMHLESGCRPCAEIVGLYRSVGFTRRVRERDAAPDPKWIRQQRTVTNIGMRAGMLADTTLVCGAGPYELDVLVREYDAPERLEFRGQVTDASRLHEPVPDLPITLLGVQPERVVTATQTDDFGEFGFGAGPEGPYGIQLGVAEDAPCVLVWEKVA